VQDTSLNYSGFVANTSDQFSFGKIGHKNLKRY
jgi:hypothetical protein